MTISITKSARQFGYIIWSSKNEHEIKKLLGNRTEVSVMFNGLSIGVKAIDWKYHRISIGYKFTRALPESATVFHITMNDDVLEVTATDDIR
ncbi:MAG: hypothetical protein ACLUDH_10645 [Faecalispora sporosphaeroides]|uniref:hypothetical protein n=1 Tax=Faecalispora sporosphaeroides TaxID=1549 RepID=UPI00399420DB